MQVPSSVQLRAELAEAPGGRSIGATPGVAAPRPRRREGHPSGSIDRVDGSRPAAGLRRRQLRLTRASAIGPSSWCWATVPTRPTTRPSAVVTGSPVSRQRVGRAVQVQHHQPARRPAEVVHPGDGLLARGSSPCPGARRSPATAPRSGWCGRRCRPPRGGGSGCAARRRPSCRPAIAPAAISADAIAASSPGGSAGRCPSSVLPDEPAAGQAAARPRCGGSAVDPDAASSDRQRAAGAGERQQREIGGRVGDLHLRPEPHAVQVAQQRGPAARARCPGRRLRRVR